MFRKIVISIVVVIVVAFGALWAAATYLLDNETIAEQLKKEVASRFNRTLVFQGNLETQFFPKVQLVLPPTTLSFEGSDKSQFTLKGAQVGVAVLPLLKGDIQFDDIVIDGLQGQINVSRVLQKAKDASAKDQSTEKKSEVEKASSEGSSFINSLEIASLEIKNSGLTVYGLQNKKIYSVSSLNLTTGAIGLSGNTPVKFSTNFAEKTQGIEGQISLDSTVTYDVHTVAAELTKPVITLSVKQKDTAASAELKASSLKYSQQDVNVSSATLTAKVNDLSLKAALAGAQTQKMQTWSVEGLTIDVADAKGLKANVAGDFSGTVEELTMQSKRLAGEIQSRVGSSTIQVPFSGVVALAANEKLSINLKGTLDKSPWQTQLLINGFSVPNVTGKVEVESLVLDKWLAQEANGAKKTALNELAVIRNAYAAPVRQLNVLNKANGRVEIHVGSLKYQGLTVTGVNTSLALSKGVLSLNNLVATTCSGKIAGNAQIDAAEKWGINLNVNGLNTEELIRSLGSNVMFYGKANASVKLNGIGIDQTSILKTVSGQMSAAANNAVLKGISLEKVAAAVKAKKVQGLIMNAQDETRFTALNATATVGNGQLVVRTLNGKTNVAEVSGNLQVGLIDNALAGEVSAKLATSVDGRRITVPIKLGGTVQSPSYGIDIEAALKAGLQSAVEEAVKDPKRLIEGLGKLFKH